MADQQPEALKLADALESYVAANTACKAAAAELRRLHTVELEAITLRAQVERLQAGGGVVDRRAVFEAWVMKHSRRPGTHVERSHNGVYKDNRVAAKWSAWEFAWNASAAFATPQPEPAPVICGNGCACAVQCGDTYAYHGKPAPASVPSAGLPANWVQLLETACKEFDHCAGRADDTEAAFDSLATMRTIIDMLKQSQ